MHEPRTRTSLPVIACGLALSVSSAVSCGDAASSSQLDVGLTEEHEPRIEARWSYQSPEVDVELVVVTVEAERCTTTARLRIDEAIAGTDIYRLPDTPCEVLRITDAGDLVLHASPTGHDWSGEALRVDTDRERIRLGPWTSSEEPPHSYRFELSAPDCGDCVCPVVERMRDDGQMLTMDLGRDCS